MNNGRTVLILGGGIGGVVAARKLRQQLPDRDRVVLVDREKDHLYQASLLWLLIGKREPDQIRRPLDQLKRNGIEVVRGEITDLDPETRRISVGGSELRGDALITSLGAELAPETIPGLLDGGHNLYTLEGTEAFRSALRRLHSARVAVLTTATGYKCPAAPYEAAMLVNDDLRRAGLGDSRVDMYTAVRAYGNRRSGGFCKCSRDD